MFSATMPEKIRQLARTILHDPVEVKLAVSKPAEKIRQKACVCYEAQKIRFVVEHFKANKPQRVIIFAGSKLKVKDLNVSLHKAGFNCRAMHSDLTQQERDEVMYAFRSGQTDILVATDIVSRGIDIDDISLVINFDVPHDAEDYVHRIGRTARAGAGGEAITLVSDKDIPKFKQIEHFLGREVEKISIPGVFVETPAYTSAPKKSSRGRKNHQNSKKRGGKGPRSKKNN